MYATNSTNMHQQAPVRECGQLNYVLLWQLELFVYDLIGTLTPAGAARCMIRCGLPLRPCSGHPKTVVADPTTADVRTERIFPLLPLSTTTLTLLQIEQIVTHSSHSFPILQSVSDRLQQQQQQQQQLSFASPHFLCLHLTLRNLFQQ